MTTLTPQTVLIGAQGGFAYPIQYQDAGGTPINLGAAGLVANAELYQANLQRTTILEVDVTNAASGLGLAIVPQDIAGSLLLAPQNGQMIAPAVAPYPVRIHAYVTDSRGLTSSHQVGAINPLDPRTADPTLIAALQPLVCTVGPAGASGAPGVPGTPGAPGSANPGTAMAAGPIALHQVIYLDPTGALPASCDQAGEAGAVLGLALGAAPLGQAVQYATGGPLTDQGWSWKIGPVYLGLAGALTQTPPTAGFSQVVGFAVGASTIIVGLRAPTVLGAEPGTGTYKDLVGGLDRLKAAAITAGSPDTLISTGPDGFASETLFAPLSLSPGKLAGGAHLASIPNGTFEDGLDGFTFGTTGTGTLAVDTSTSIVGRNSIYMRCSAAGDTATIASGLIPVGEAIPVYMGVRAKLRGGTANCTLSALFYTASGVLIGPAQQIGAALALTAIWAEFGDLVLPPAGTRYAAVQIANAGAVGAVGSVSIDEMMLQRQTGGPKTAQVIRAAKPILVAAGGSWSGFLAAQAGDPNATDGSWEAVTTDPQAPIGGILYGLILAYLTSSAPSGLGVAAPQAALQIAAMWAATTSITS